MSRLIFLEYAYQHGEIANMMCSGAQEICEKYMRHLIEKYYHPQTFSDQQLTDSILRTHSLRRLSGFLSEHMNIRYSDDCQAVINQIDGFYFSTRYPGDESFMATAEDVELAHQAVTQCREETFQMIEELERQAQQSRDVHPAESDNKNRDDRGR